MEEVTLRIYLTNLRMYNEGELFGEWVELPIDDDEFEEIYNRITSGGEDEHFITDYENDFDYRVHEFESIWTLNEVMEELNSIHEPAVVIKAVIRACDNDLQEAISVLREGRFLIVDEVENDHDLGAMFYENGLSGFQIPESIECYFDFEAYGRDIRLNSAGAIYPDLKMFVEID